jgi:hypothetical protein
MTGVAQVKGGKDIVAGKPWIERVCRRAYE